MGAPPFKRAVCASLIAPLLTVPAFAGPESGASDPDIAELKHRLDEQARLLAEQKRALDQQAEDLAKQKNELRTLREQLGTGAYAAPSVSPSELERRRAAGQHGAGGPQPGGGSATAPPPRPEPTA
ncbi:MAG TPA: hypothetical protein VLW45_06995, partial [Pelomicrobium sp.]|nr:hypothetical protein [Pelomicrobium sp.]